MTRIVHVSMVDGEPWLPFMKEYVHGPLDDRPVQVVGSEPYRVAKVTDGESTWFLGFNQAVYNSILAGDYDCLGVNLLALSDWPDWEVTYKGADLLTRHVGLCRVVPKAPTTDA